MTSANEGKESDSGENLKNLLIEMSAERNAMQDIIVLMARALIEVGIMDLTDFEDMPGELVEDSDSDWDPKWTLFLTALTWRWWAISGNISTTWKENSWREKRTASETGVTPRPFLNHRAVPARPAQRTSDP